MWAWKLFIYKSSLREQALQGLEKKKTHFKMLGRQSKQCVCAAWCIHCLLGVNAVLPLHQPNQKSSASQTEGKNSPAEEEAF